MTRKRYILILLALIALVASSLACGPTRLSQGDVDAAVTATMAAIQTERALVEGGQQQGSPDDQPTLAPPPTEPPTAEPATATPVATNTPTVTPTEIPCDRATFITDVTVPDGSDYAPGDSFVKTWRLKNTGSCTWSSSYALVFHSGDAMNAPAAVQLTSGTVAPGASVDVSVQLTAPNSAGTYKGFFRLRNGSGVVFGIGDNATVSFWVEIEVLTALAPPDLVVTAIDFDPYPPTKNDSVTVRVKIKNQGGTTEEGFTVKWWPGENYPNPATSWNMNGGLDAGETVTLTYVYAGYPSTYGSINTKAVIDTGDTVGESNEGNNTFLRNIKVDP
jgi:hypothetical protein